MEKDTAYAYQLDSLKDVSLMNIYSLSWAFINQLAPEAYKPLSETTKNNCNRFGKRPCDEAQMHAYIYANLPGISESISRLLYEKDKGLTEAKDYAIVDYDCGLGLSAISLINHFKARHHEEHIKEIILVEADKACLDRAELLVKAMLPSASIKAINKSAKALSCDEYRPECVMTYHLFCDAPHGLPYKLLKSALEDNRFLFAKAVCREGCFDHRANYELQNELYYNEDGYGFLSRCDVDAITPIVEHSEPKSHFESFYDNLDSLKDPDHAHFDPRYDSIASFVKKGDGAPIVCFNFFKRNSEESTLAKINLAICLIEAIGCDKDCKSAIEILSPLAKGGDDFFISKILNLLSRCSDNEDSIISYLRQLIALDIDEEDKCTSRFNLTIYLKDKPNSLAEREELCLKCIASGCRKCHEASNYDADKGSCPRAQKVLYDILRNRGEKEASLSLLHESARQGYMNAELELGLHYFYGEGVEKDIPKAIELYRNAAYHGSEYAHFLLYKALSSDKPAAALRHLIISCKAKDKEAQEKIFSYESWLTSGKLQSDLWNNWIVSFAEQGEEKYKDDAIKILTKTGNQLMYDEEIDAAREKFEHLAAFDKALSEKKLQELEDNLPDWYDDDDDIIIEPYPYGKSMMDALDGDPDAYWNID